MVPGEMRSRLGALCFVALAAGATGCANDPDIVAKTIPNSTSTLIPSPSETPACEAGRYSGTMTALPGDGGASISFAGTFEFTLVESLSGEFLVLQNTAQLSGSGANGTTFHADIEGGGGCTSGASFETDLINGSYEIPGVASIPFEGSIVGAYNAKHHSFWGDWTTHLHPPLSADPLTVGGSWSATFRAAQ